MTDETLTLKFKLTQPFGPLGIRSIRKTIAFLAGQWDFSEKSRDNITLALSEAINNAREHGSDPNSRIEVLCVLSARLIKLRIDDFGEGADCDTKRDGTKIAFETTVAPSSDSERGRGVFLMRSLMDSVEMGRNKEGGITIKMIKRGP